MLTLELRGLAGRVFGLTPHGLWITGNNGRVDLKGDGSRYIHTRMARGSPPANYPRAIGTS